MISALEPDCPGQKLAPHPQTQTSLQASASLLVKKLINQFRGCNWGRDHTYRCFYKKISEPMCNVVTLYLSHKESKGTLAIYSLLLLIDFREREERQGERGRKHGAWPV